MQVDIKRFKRLHNNLVNQFPLVFVMYAAIVEEKKINDGRHDNLLDKIRGVDSEEFFNRLNICKSKNNKIYIIYNTNKNNTISPSSSLLIKQSFLRHPFNFINPLTVSQYKKLRFALRIEDAQAQSSIKLTAILSNIGNLLIDIAPVIDSSVAISTPLILALFDEWGENYL